MTAFFDFSPLTTSYRSPRVGRAAERHADVCRRLCEARSEGANAISGGSADTPARTPRRSPATAAAKKDGGSDDGEPAPRFTISRQDGVVIGAATAGTLLFLIAQYSGRAIVPIETVCADYFAPLTLPNLRRKIAAGDIPLPLGTHGSRLEEGRAGHPPSRSCELYRRTPRCRRQRA